MEDVILYNEATGWGRKSIVVLDGGRAIVMASVLDADPKVAIVHDLVVHPSARREGRGRRLLKYARFASADMGADAMRVLVEPGTWQADWYKRMGFKDAGIVDAAGHDFQVLEKDITRREAEEPQDSFQSS